MFLKFIYTNNFYFREWYRLQNSKMTIFRYYVFGVCRNCTIHKFIVIFVYIYQTKTEMRIFPDNIGSCQYRIHDSF